MTAPRTTAPLSADYFAPLLAATLSSAAASPLYSVDPAWAAGYQEYLASGSLREVPFFTKQLYRDRSAGIEQPADVIVQHTKGTTGEVTFRYRRAADIAFVSGVNAAIHEIDDSHGLLAPLVLRELDGSHGQSLAGGSRHPGLTTSGDPRGFRRAVHLLTHRFAIAGVQEHVSVVSGRLRFLIVLAMTLEAEGVSPGSLGVSTLLTYGSFISPYWRDWLERTWQATLLDCYSLSEILGSASHCPQCGRYRFDEPTVYAEFADPASGEPVPSGWAVPVLTELVPYVCHEPFVRYWTDDLVLVDNAPCCGPGAFAFKGRLPSAVRDLAASPPRILVPWAELVEVLERTDRLVWDIDPLDWGTRDGRVTARLARSPAEVPRLSTAAYDADGRRRVELTVTLHPGASTANDNRVAEDLRDRLLSNSSLLARAVRGNEYDLVVRAVRDPAPSPARPEARSFVNRVGVT
jgi:hypothetical protein